MHPSPPSSGNEGNENKGVHADVRSKSKPRSRLRTLIFMSTPSLVLIGIFMLGFIGSPEDSIWLNRSTIWGRGDPFYRDADERFVAHPTLIWRGRPNHRGTSEYTYGGAANEFEHNSLGLRDDEFDRSKNEGVIRVLNIGDSATWGLNLARRADTYSDQLETLMRGRGPRYEIINCGMIGYSSLQGVRFLQQWLDDLEPDVVTVYLGNNDSQASGAKDIERSPHEPNALGNWLSHNFFYLLARKGFLSLTKAYFEQRAEEFMQKVSQRGGGALDCPKDEYYRDLARVAPDEYERNLRDMIALCRERNVRLILLKVPMNLVWPLVTRPTFETAFMPNGYWRPTFVPPQYLARALAGEAPPAGALTGHPYLCVPAWKQVVESFRRAGVKTRAMIKHMSDTAANEQSPVKSRVLALNNLGVCHLLQGNVDGAVELVEKAIVLSARPEAGISRLARAQLFYTLGIGLLLQGKKQESLAELRRARESVPFAFSPDYEERFDRVVRELGVEWIDLPVLFAEADPRFGGSALIHDWVHPDAKGNRVIAEAIAEALLSSGK